MKNFYDIAQSVAKQTRQYLAEKKQPDDNGAIMVHFEVCDPVFAKAYFGEDCQNVRYAFPFNTTGRFNPYQRIKCSELIDKQLILDDFTSSVDDSRIITALIKKREGTKEGKILLKINIAICSYYDEVSDDINIKKRTVGSIDGLHDCLSSICGEYCATTFSYYL